VSRRRRACGGSSGRRVYGVLDYTVTVDVADGNEYERFQTQKMTKLPVIHHII
jgi:DNA-binding Lrp family transcriptional regulator